MLYDGLGNHLQIIAYADGQSVTTQYDLDNGRVLSADAAGNVTYYLGGSILFKNVTGQSKVRKHQPFTVLFCCQLTSRLPEGWA
jgi:hypothetical protein